MDKHNLDSLVVKNEDGTYAGIVSIDEIASSKKSVEATIEGLVRKENCVCYVDENAQECYDRMIASGDRFVVVLNLDDTIAGIVTKTSMVKAMADVLWGEAL